MNFNIKENMITGFLKNSGWSVGNGIIINNSASI